MTRYYNGKAYTSRQEFIIQWKKDFAVFIAELSAGKYDVKHINWKRAEHMMNINYSAKYAARIYLSYKTDA